MCLSTVYKGDSVSPENILAESVVGVKAENDEIRLTDITGEEFLFRGKLRSVDLIDDRIFIDLEP